MALTRLNKTQKKFVRFFSNNKTCSDHTLMWAARVFGLPRYSALQAFEYVFGKTTNNYDRLRTAVLQSFGNNSEGIK